MAARVNKIRHDENTRQKIKVGNIVDRLEKLIAGEIDMKPHAVTAALGLLRKVLPDVTSVELSGEISTSKVIRTPTISPSVSDWINEHGKETLQ